VGSSSTTRTVAMPGIVRLAELREPEMHGA
jgi:hypothetical protein